MDNDNAQRRVQYSDKSVGDLKVIELIIVLFIIWVLVDLWVIFFRDLSRRTFGLDERNPVHAFAFAFVVTAILIAFILLAGDSVQEALINIGAIPEEFDPAGFAGGGNASVDVALGGNPAPNEVANPMANSASVGNSTNIGQGSQAPNTRVNWNISEPNILDSIASKNGGDKEDYSDDVLFFVSRDRNKWNIESDYTDNKLKKKKKKKRKN